MTTPVIFVNKSGVTSDTLSPVRRTLSYAVRVLSVLCVILRHLGTAKIDHCTCVIKHHLLDNIPYFIVYRWKRVLYGGGVNGDVGLA